MENKKVKPILILSFVCPPDGVDIVKNKLKEQGAYDDYVIIIKNSPDKEGATLISQNEIKSVEIPYLMDSTRLFKTPLRDTNTYLKNGYKEDIFAPDLREDQLAFIGNEFHDRFKKGRAPQFPADRIENHGEIKYFWLFALIIILAFFAVGLLCK